MLDPKPLPGYGWVEEFAQQHYLLTGQPLVISPELYRTLYGTPPSAPLLAEAAEAIRRAFEDA